MMDLQEFAELVKQAYANLGMKSPASIKSLWQAFHLLKKNVTLPEFQILLKQLHEFDFRQYEMVRGSLRFPDNARYGIMSDNGLLCYFRYMPRALKCPHCNGGHLSKSKFKHPTWDYDCDKCGRGWKKLPDGSYESVGATDVEVISKENWEKWTE